MTRYWGDLKVGESFPGGSLTLAKEDILSFAAEFDPQPYHLDSEAAKTSIFGGLCASGWQVSAMMMRLLSDAFRQQDIAIIGVAGVSRMRWFEDIPVGEFHVFGSHTFGELEIIEFGEKYAPEIYHTDPDAARETYYRGLVASGWHLTAVWMRLMVEYMERFATGVQDGRRNGAGIGLEDLEWYQPVRPGHTLTYTYEITDKPDKVIRDHWGIIRSRNEAFNQYNERVMSFNIDILAERAPKEGTPK